MVNICENLTLRGCRVITGIKAEELAACVGVSVDTIYKWEKGRSYPNAPQMVKMIDCFADRGFIVNISDINFFDH